MIRIGITGQSGFVGTHLYNLIGLHSLEFERIPFEDAYFKDETILQSFVKKCDGIVHLAAINRHSDPKVIFETNIKLVKQLINAMEKERVTPYLIFASSTQEEYDNEYGKSKREGRTLFEDWAKRNGASFTGMIVPNVFGPFCLPNYNSFVATFCHKLTHGMVPKIKQDNDIKLIYVGNLCAYIIRKINDKHKILSPIIERDQIFYDFEIKVTKLLSLLEKFKIQYFDQGLIPELKDGNEINLFNTFRSYIDYSMHFPVKLRYQSDYRGIFVETIKLGIGGQVSFSTTIPYATRGNHFHTRKIERFTVIKGNARIQLRKIGSKDIMSFFLDGNEPSFVDMPIWYTHNITNIGNTELYTQFWINELYDPVDNDTYFEKM